MLQRITIERFGGYVISVMNGLQGLPIDTVEVNALYVRKDTNLLLQSKQYSSMLAKHLRMLLIDIMSIMSR